MTLDSSLFPLIQFWICHTHTRNIKALAFIYANANEGEDLEQWNFILNSQVHKRIYKIHTTGVGPVKKLKRQAPERAWLSLSIGILGHSVPSSLASFFTGYY